MTMRLRMRLPWCAILALYLLLPFSASAGEFFVDAATGDDARGNGSAARPWRTIQHALETVNAAEAAVWVGPGAYRERIEAPASLKKLALIGAGSSHTTVDAVSVAPDGAAVVLHEGLECWLEGMTFLGGGTDCPERGEVVARNGAVAQFADCTATYVRLWSDDAQPPLAAGEPPSPSLLLEKSYADPEPGLFLGLNDQLRPMAFTVASMGDELRTFQYSLKVYCETCNLNSTVTTDWFDDGPPIVRGEFEFVLTLGGADWKFTGRFNTPQSLVGTWTAPDNDLMCGPCSASGVWTADRELFQPDVNHDDFINAVDVQLVINEALAIVSGLGGDINGDGTVNAIDVQLVVNAVLGLHSR